MRPRLRRWVGRVSLAMATAVFALSATATFFAHEADAQSVRPPEGAVVNAPPPAPGEGATLEGLIGAPGGALSQRGASSDSDLWRAVRTGDAFATQKRSPTAGVLVQSEGAAWQEMRGGPLSQAGLFALGAMFAILVLFALIRGKIRVDAGLSGQSITRFQGFERFGHWLLAVSFIVLGVTGLCMLYGRDALIPLIGKEAFAAFMVYAKLSHNYLAFAFMAGLAMTFVIWVVPNIPHKYDLIWLMKLGGLFTRNVHPPAKKFNAGQKIMFWSTMLLGLSLCLSGWALLFPFEYHFFAPTFQTLNVLGLNLPTELTAMQEMQLAQLWHGLVGAIMVALIIAHIYIGSVGMEGAFDAMGSGEVDINWAREHHGMWVDEIEARAARETPAKGAATPAE